MYLTNNLPLECVFMLFEHKQKYLDVIFPGLLEKGLVQLDRKYSCACGVVTWFLCVLF